MKSYTDLEQSKKLAEFLPLETADAFYASDAGVIIVEPYITVLNGEINIPACDGAVPCWSLTALLGIIPYNVTFNRAVYRFELVKYSDHWECYHENFGMVSTEIFKADNPVDACVAMIEKLHELNLL